MLLEYISITYDTSGFRILSLPWGSHLSDLFLFPAELGDFDSSLHTDGYISEFRFIPDQSEDFEQHVGELHQSLR